MKEKIKSTSLFILVFLAYIISGKLGLRFAVVSPSATAIWAPTGVAIAAFLIFGYQLWPAVFLGAFITNITTAGTFLTSIGIATGNTLEGLVAAYLVNRFANGLRTFNKTQDVFKFFVFAGIVGPAVSASFGVTTLALAGFTAWSSYSSTWGTWWLGDLGGALIVAPFLLVWFTDHTITWGRQKLFEILTLTVLISAFALFALKSGPGSVYIFYLFTPIFVWGAFRFSQRETATAVFAVTAIVLWETFHGFGPFVQEVPTLNGALLLLEATMATMFVTMMALTATAGEHEKTASTLATRNEKMAHEKAVDDAIIASIGDGLIVTDKDGNIVLANSQAEALLGWTAEEMTGRKYYDAIPMENEEGGIVALSERPLVQTLALRKKISSGPVFAPRYYKRKDGARFPVSFTKTPIMLDGEVIGAIEIFRDSTKGVEMDRAKSDFVSLASHQLRTPLSVISIYSELLDNQGKLFGKHDEQECRQYAQEIHKVTMQMADLINDLLNVSRIDTQMVTVNPGSINLKKVVDGILRELTFKAFSKELSITTHYEEDLPGFVTDAHLLGVVIENLLSNAIKYTPPGGKILLSANTKDGHMIITVTDTGHGIPVTQQEEIFKKFFRADNARRIESEGTGLGLYIAKSLMDRLGGTIYFRSREGQGSTFVLELPLQSILENEKTDDAVVALPF